MNIVISQPMYFPWLGQIEKIRLADVLVHYDDVQYSKGSFVNRVQIKTANGPRWLTVPVRDLHLGQRICDVRIDHSQDWRARHRAAFREHYGGAPYFRQALAVLEAVLADEADSLADIAVASVERLCECLGARPAVGVVRSSQLNVPGRGSGRLRDIVLRLRGNAYLCGYAGASRYLDVALLEAAGIRVDGVWYEPVPYPQLHGPFTSAVSALDLVANVGPGANGHLIAHQTPWRDAPAATRTAAPHTG